MDYPAARALVQRYVDRSNAKRITYWDGKVQPEVVIFDEYTKVRLYGWVFFVNSVVYRETRDVMHMFVGGGPLIVRRDTGELHTFGSACTLEMYVAGTIPYDTRVDMDDDVTP